MIKIKEPLHQPAKTALSSVVCVCMYVCVCLFSANLHYQKKNTESEKGGSATPKEMHFFIHTFTI